MNKDTFYCFLIVYRERDSIKSVEFYARDCECVSEAFDHALQFARGMFGEYTISITLTGIK